MILAVVGKGGVGKTTVTALLLGRLIRAGKAPVLAVDADPASCLGAVLGLAHGPTLGELRDRLRNPPEGAAAGPKSDQLARLAAEAIVEEDRFDLLTMGYPEGPGCYCFVNNLLRDYLARLGRSYRHVLVDCEAGQEHLSRRTTARPDVLVCVVGRGRLGALAVGRSLALFWSLHGGPPPRLELILNGVEPETPLAETLRAAAAGSGAFAFARTWTLPHDAAITELELAGRSLLELPPESPANRALAGWEGVL